MGAVPGHQRELLVGRGNHLRPTSSWRPQGVALAHPLRPPTACWAQVVGGRRGWRLPSFAELSSLVDADVAQPGPTLPPGHPFLNVQSSNYWSATTRAVDPTVALTVDFNLGNVFAFSKSTIFSVWCVRGGMNADQY